MVEQTSLTEKFEALYRRSSLREFIADLALLEDCTHASSRAIIDRHRGDQLLRQADANGLSASRTIGVLSLLSLALIAGLVYALWLSIWNLWQRADARRFTARRDYPLWTPELVALL
jgi:hypothetical protein